MVTNRNDLSDLSVFLLIVRYRSFRKAADQLDLSVSALSHRMKALEARLGVRLLNRTSRSVAPTAAGAVLADKVAAGLDIINGGIEELQGQFSGIAGSVRINVLKDAVPLLLQSVLPVIQILSWKLLLMTTFLMLRQRVLMPGSDMLALSPRI